MASQFEKYESELVELIKSAKIKLADEVPVAKKGMKITLFDINNYEHTADKNSLKKLKKHLFEI